MIGRKIFLNPFVFLVAVGLTICLLATGCQKTITLEQQPYTEKISIEGLLQPGEIPKVYVNRTAPFFVNPAGQTASSLFVKDAQIVIEGNGNVDFLEADSTFNQFFCRWEPYYVGQAAILDNTTYELRVTHAGKTYTASAMTNVSAVQIDSVSYTTSFTDIFGGHEGVILDFTDLPNQGNQYRFMISRKLTNEHETTDDLEYSSTCLPDEEVIDVIEYGRFVYFDDNLDGAPVRFVAEPAYTQFQGDESTVFIQSLDEQVGFFYDTLDRQHEANINPFAEPVFLYSNIEGAIGVFGAVNRSAPIPFVFPEDHLN